MKTIAEYFKQILEDVQVEATEEFDKNFERKAFFDENWEDAKWQNQNGSLMMRSGNLRGSINSNIQADEIVFTSSLPYASIHNQGGKITVTENMKKYFWAKYYENVTVANMPNAWNHKIISQAITWKAMALKPVGASLIIPKRQFIGNHPQVEEFVKNVVEENLQEIEQDIFNNFKSLK